MADGQATSLSVSYLTTPSNVPAMRHGGSLNLVLIAATATIVTILCLFLAGVTYYFLRRRHLKKKEQAAQERDNSTTMSNFSHLELSQSVLGSEQDMESSRHSRTTCDSCSSRLRHSRPVLPRTSIIHQRHSRPLHSSFVMTENDELITQEEQRTSAVRRLSVQVNRAFNRGTLASPTLEEVLTDYKAAAVFDWDRCAFEDQEEKSMWLSSRPHSFTASKKTLQRNQPLIHNRACSESITLSPSPTRIAFPTKNVPKITKTITWNHEPQELPPSDYFGLIDRSRQFSQSSLSLGLSPAFSCKNSPLSTPSSTASSSDASLPLPVAPLLVHSPQRQSYCVRAEAQDWESHADAVEHVNTSRRLRASYPASISISSLPPDPVSPNSLASKVSSKPSQNTSPSNNRLSRLQIPSLSESKALCSSPLAISAYSHTTFSPSLVEEHWPPTVGVLQENQSKDGVNHQRTKRYSAAATDVSSPMQLHRFSRRGALSSPDWPIQSTNNNSSDALARSSKYHARRTLH